jgi:hypothetical protein
MDTLLALWHDDFDRAHRRLYGEALQTVERVVAERRDRPVPYCRPGRAKSTG